MSLASHSSHPLNCVVEATCRLMWKETTYGEWRVIVGIVYVVLAFVIGMLCGVALACIVQIDRLNKERQKETANSNSQK